MQNVTWLKKEVSLKRVLVFRTHPVRFRRGNGERGRTCHKITIGMMAIMKITMGNRPNWPRTRNEAHSRACISGISKAARWQFARQFSFHYPSRFTLSSVRSLLPFPPFCPSPSSRLIVHRFGNNVHGFLIGHLCTRVEKSLLPSRYVWTYSPRSTLSRLRHPLFSLLFFPFFSPQATKHRTRCTHVASFIRCRVNPH